MMPLLLVLMNEAARAQILTNGGFELGLAGWSTSLSAGGVASFTNATANIHTGTNALLVSVTSAGTASNSVRLVANSFATSHSDTYVLRFWASSSVLRANLGVSLNGALPAFPEIPFEISTNDHGYQEYLYSFQAIGKVSIAFDFQSVGAYWLDDVEVLDLNNNDGWDIPMTYLWQWGQLNASKTNSVGWSGGDNGKSALLPDGSVAWIFNDTLASSLNFYSNIRGDCSLPRNSVVHQVGTNLIWLNNGKETFFVPTNPANLYWIGDGVVESNKLLVLLTEVHATEITRVGTAIGTLSLPDLTLDSIVEVPSPGEDNYGAMVNGGDGFYYIYNAAQVARVPLGNLAVGSAWTYWNGSGWATNHLEAADFPGLINPWSVAKIGPSNYAAVYMPELSLTIMAQFASSPMGPWSQSVPLYNTAGQWGELNYAPNVCAGSEAAGSYTIGYSDDGSPEDLDKWVSDKSFYNPHFIKANLAQLSPYSLASGAEGPGSRISIKFAADMDYGNDAIDNRWGAGVLNTTNWFNLFGPDGGSNGMSAVPYYISAGAKYASRTTLVYDWANEHNFINNNAPLTNNLALLDGFISVNNNCWYLSVTNLDGVFTNGYSVYFYYNGGAVGRGGQNYIRYYQGLTTNTAEAGRAQWNLYTTAANTGRYTRDMTPSNMGTSGETAGANYFVYSNLTGGAFDLLVTNGNFAGVNALEIIANAAVTGGTLSVQSSAGGVVLNWASGTLLQATNLYGPWTTNNAVSPYTNNPVQPRMFYRILIR